MRLEPDGRNIQSVVFPDGAERNRLVVNIANLEPLASNYNPRYDSGEPRYRVQ